MGRNIQPTLPLVYNLKVKDLARISLTGAGSIEAASFSNAELSVDISGAGSVKLSGTVDTQVIEVADSGTYEAPTLNSKNVKVGGNGTGEATVHAVEKLEVEIKDLGVVKYHGNPELTITTESELGGLIRLDENYWLFCVPNWEMDPS